MELLRVGYRLSARKPEYGALRFPWRERVMAYVEMGDPPPAGAAAPAPRREPGVALYGGCTPKFGAAAAPNFSVFEFPHGARVAIVGVSRPEYNGARGLATALVCATAQSVPRFRVQLDGGKLLALKPENVRPLQAAPRRAMEAAFGYGAGEVAPPDAEQEVIIPEGHEFADEDEAIAAAILAAVVASRMRAEGAVNAGGGGGGGGQEG